MSDAFETPKANDTREFDHWGRRLLPDPDNMSGGRVGWTRATTLASTVDDMWNIHQWELRMVAHGLTKREDLYALAFNMDPDEDKQDLQQVCSDAMEAAKVREGANYGTALHGYVEQAERAPGKPVAMPARWRPYVDAYIAGMKRANLTSAAVECIVVNKACKSAGKFDNLLAAGSIALSNGVPTTYTIGDLKTEKGGDTEEESFTYSQRRIAIQLAIYANAEWLWRPAINDYVPMPMVRKDIAYVIHLPVTAPTPEFSIWEVNIAAGWEAVQLALDVRKWRNRKGLMKPITNTSPGRTEESRTDAAVAAKLAVHALDPEQSDEAIGAMARDALTMATQRDTIKCAKCGKVDVEPPNSWCPQCSMSATIESGGLTVVAPSSTAEPEHDEPGGTVPDEHGVLHLDDVFSWPTRARAVRTREDASKLWREATDAGVWSAELEALAKESLANATQSPN